MVIARLAAVTNNPRLHTCLALLVIALLSWWYLLDMDMMAMMIMGPWQSSDWLYMFLMWAIMMVAMMLPSALPMILMHQVIAARRQPQLNTSQCNWIFTLGYILAWTLFSAGATLLQWLLQQNALLTPMLEPGSIALSALILMAAGIYQWLPIKNNCLAKCRAPVEYLTTHWRNGLAGSLSMGLQHGLYCLGCCWVLMLLLFAGGVMNLRLVAAIALFVLLEKVLPAALPLSKLSGFLLILAGAYLLYGY
jgi:predicted metal-binding membrane protein